jgi:hypothetical protein
MGSQMGIQDAGWDGVFWFYLAQEREKWRALVITVLNLRDS